MPRPRPEIEAIAIVGAGTMGAGIAQVAAMGGLRSLIFDPVPEARDTVRDRIAGSLERGIGRGFWSAEQVQEGLARIEIIASLDAAAEAGLAIEAAPESLDLKRQVFAQLESACPEETILATNTSSLSVTAIAGGMAYPERALGLHFFNPVPAMRLVEVVSGEATSPEIAERARQTVIGMGKTAIQAKDAIGFVANRCARPFTLEGLRIASELGLPPAEIDRVCRVGGGFPMGPFELIDLVGADINLAVARSFHEQSFGEPRWRPSLTQVRMVEAGRLGRKSGRGFYEYGDGPHREPDPEVDAPRPILDPGPLVELAGPEAASVMEWMSAQIVNESIFALAAGIATEADIDTAMLEGFKWPLGPIEWGRRIGFQSVIETLERLRREHGEAYRPAPLLKEMA